MAVTENQYHVLTVTEDAGLAGQVESSLAGVIPSIRNIGERDIVYETLNDKSIVFLDARSGRENTNTMVTRIKRAGGGASVLVIATDNNPDAVLESIRAGASDYLSHPATPEDIAEAARRIVSMESNGTSAGKIIALFSLKGGQGITSLATNLVDHIHSLTRETSLLADLNLYMGHAGLCLDLACNYTPIDLINDLDRVDDNLLFSSLVRHNRGFHVLGISEQIADAAQITGEEIKRMLYLLRLHLRYTVLDLPHDLSGLTLAGLDVADRILLVVQQDIPSLKNAQTALRVFSDLDYNTDNIRVVVNRYVKRNQIDIQDIETALKRPVYATIGNDYNTIAMVYNRGQTVDMAMKKSRINKELKKLAESVTGVISNPRKRGRRRGRLFSRS